MDIKPITMYHFNKSGFCGVLVTPQVAKLLIDEHEKCVNKLKNKLEYKHVEQFFIENELKKYKENVLKILKKHEDKFYPYRWTMEYNPEVNKHAEYLHYGLDTKKKITEVRILIKDVELCYPKKEKVYILKTRKTAEKICKLNYLKEIAKKEGK